MMDITDVARQVQRNCEISDAEHWGSYTICGLLIRLMDLYRWSKGIEPWVKIENPLLMDFVGEKEKEWEKLRGRGFGNIVIDGTEFDAFDAEGINDVVGPWGFIYGAGYATAMKPSFFLAKKEETRTQDGLRIIIAGRELARDLITMPAMLLGDTIFVRTEPARSFMWGKIAEFGFSGNESLKKAFSYYGVDIDSANPKDVDMVARRELESYIRHEIGECADTTFPWERWEEIVSAHPLTLLEKFARLLKDILADTNVKGTLRYIIDTKNRGSLGFYAALQSELVKTIFPEVVRAIDSFEGEWSKIEEARKMVRGRASEFAGKLIEMYDGGMSPEDIEKELIQPLLP
jgi:hypothetical protein